MKKRAQSASKTHTSPPRIKFIPGDHLRMVYTEKQIQKRVRQLADQINRDYQGRTLNVVGILENCFMFMADLVRLLKIPVICHFVKAEIHDSSSGGVALREILYTPRVTATGKDILLVDGILQSGVTLEHLYHSILGRQPNSVRTATLIEKTDERKVGMVTNYLGFKTTEKFLVGYGLGYQEKYRNLPYIARLA